MPEPSSMMRIRLRPPASMAISIDRAPASMAFSTSSLTAEAGRSTTSPAAIRSIRIGSRRRTAILRARRSEPYRAPDDGDEQRTFAEHALGGAFGIVERHCIDHRIALVEVIDIQSLDLEVHQLAGDLQRGIETQGIGAGQIA